MYYLTVIELVTFFTGVLTWKVIGPRRLRWVTVILGVTALNESLLVPLAEKYHLGNQNVLYNAFSLVDMCVWLYLFYLAPGSRLYRWLVLAASDILVVYSLYELCVQTGWKRMHVNSFRVYELAVILCAVYYIRGLLQKDYHNLTTDFFFWCCAACIVYHGLLFLNFTTMAEHNYWKLKNAVDIFFILQDVAGICYYLLLCTGFLMFFLKSRVSKTSSPKL